MAWGECWAVEEGRPGGLVGCDRMGTLSTPRPLQRLDAGQGNAGARARIEGIRMIVDRKRPMKHRDRPEVGRFGGNKVTVLGMVEVEVRWGTRRSERMVGMVRPAQGKSSCSLLA